MFCFNTMTLTKKSLKIQKGGNQNPYIEEEQKTQWAKDIEQKDKQRSTKQYTESKRSSNTNPTKHLKGKQFLFHL